MLKLTLLLLTSCILAIAIQIFWFSPISPAPLQFFPSSSSLWPPNNYLQRVIKMGEGYLSMPEDICFDNEGVLYTATGDGWIKRIHKNGTIQDWKMLHSNSLLGITITKENDLIVCDADKGLLKVNEEGIAVVASHVNGTKLRFPDDVIAASDGTLYFSEASTKFDYHNWRLDYLEAKPYGLLLKYDPFLDETSIVLDNLYLANGVALSRDEDYVLVCETFRFRCLKHWLKGERKGTTDTFIDKLPGAPDNINLAPDGSFWIALLQITDPNPITEFLLPNKAFRHLLATSPKLLNPLIPASKNPSVVNVAEDGQIIRKFDDPDGKVMSFITSAYEFEDHLYLGSLGSNFIGKLPLIV
ncbi:hypothetical protein ACFE04_017797 [Oxalis oulophora]